MKTLITIIDGTAYRGEWNYFVSEWDYLRIDVEHFEDQYGCHPRQAAQVYPDKFEVYTATTHPATDV